jgi:hypothetical protein
MNKWQFERTGLDFPLLEYDWSTGSESIENRRKKK